MRRPETRGTMPRGSVMRRALGAAAAVSLLVGTASSSALPPAQDTDAAFTHAQSAQGQNVSAAVVPPVANLSCSGSLLTGRITIEWSPPQAPPAMELIEYRIQRFESGSSTPLDTYTDDESPFRSPSSLTLLNSSRWEIRTVSETGWVSVPWQIDVSQVLGTLSCDPADAPG